MSFRNPSIIVCCLWTEWTSLFPLALVFEWSCFFSIQTWWWLVKYCLGLMAALDFFQLIFAWLRQNRAKKKVGFKGLKALGHTVDLQKNSVVGRPQKCWWSWKLGKLRKACARRPALCIYTVRLSIHLFSVCLAHREIDYGLFRRKAGAPSLSLSPFIKTEDEGDERVRMDGSSIEKKEEDRLFAFSWKRRWWIVRGPDEWAIWMEGKGRDGWSVSGGLTWGNAARAAGF